MKGTCATDNSVGQSLRMDILLWRLRFFKSRSLSNRFLQKNAVRLNNRRILRASQRVKQGDIVTMPYGDQILAFQVESLPARRGPAKEVQSCYQRLDLD